MEGKVFVLSRDDFFFIKSVITTLPLFTCLFRMPRTIVNNIKCIQKQFLWDWAMKGKRVI